MDINYVSQWTRQFNLSNGQFFLVYSSSSQFMAVFPGFFQYFQGFFHCPVQNRFFPGKTQQLQKTCAHVCAWQILRYINRLRVCSTIWAVYIMQNVNFQQLQKTCAHECTWQILRYINRLRVCSAIWAVYINYRKKTCTAIVHNID